MKTEKLYKVQHTETGTVVEYGLNYSEAEKIVEKFESEDRGNGDFEEDFYEIEEIDGISANEKTVYVNMDKFTGRERFYAGSRAGQVLAFEREKNPDLFQVWSDHFERKINRDIQIAITEGLEYLPGVRFSNKGFLIE